MTSLSLRAFARRIGVNDRAVRKAIASGRLKKSVGANAKGQPVIKNPALALKEWTANAAKVGKRAAPTLVDAQRELALERARSMALNRLVKEGRLIDLGTVERGNFHAARTIRDSMLNIPPRLSGALAAEFDAAKVFTMLDAEIRLALTAVADILKAGAGKDKP